MRRNVVKIDEEKCDGCGECVPACAEGAIEIIDGKARLVSDVYCDGLGACLGECPQGAISIEEREAEGFDDEAAKLHVARTSGVHAGIQSRAEARAGGPGGGCPGMASQVLVRTDAKALESSDEQQHVPSSRLGNWPLQLTLVPVRAPYFQGADIVISADCAPFAYADFHRRFLEGKLLIIGCPKLDDAAAYRGKLAEIFKQNEINSVEVVHMEVPCCLGLLRLVQLALEDSGRDIPVTATEVSIRGEVQGVGTREDS